MNIRIVDYQSSTAADNIELLRVAIKNQKSGLRKNDFPFSDLNTWIGRVAGIDDIDLGEWQSRNNAMAAFGLQQGCNFRTIRKTQRTIRPKPFGNRYGVKHC